MMDASVWFEGKIEEFKDDPEYLKIGIEELRDVITDRNKRIAKLEAERDPVVLLGGPDRRPECR